MNPNAPVGDGDAAAFTEFLFHLHHRRRLAVATCAAVFSIALVIAALIPSTYKATASVTVLPAPEYTVRPQAGSAEVNNTALAMDQILQSESEILDSDDLHLAVLRRLGPGNVYAELEPDFQPSVLAGALQTVLHMILLPWRPEARDPAAARTEAGLIRFRRHLTVLPSKDGNVISVDFTHQDPELAAHVLNALIAEYSERRSVVYQDPQLDAVRSQAEAAARAVASAEWALAEFKRLHDISDAPTQRALMLHRRSDADQATGDAAASAAEQQARLQALSVQLKAEPVTVELYQERDPDTRVQTLLASLQDLHGRLAAARGRYLDTSRMVRDLDMQITSREGELRRLQQDPTASIVRTGRNPAVDQLRLDHALAAANYAASTARRDAAAAQSLQIGSALAALDANEVRLAALQRHVTLETDALATESRILAGRRLTEAEDALRFARVRVIQPARVPQRPRPVPLLIAAAGLLMGIVTAAVRVIASFMLHPTFFTPEGLEAASGLEVLAGFPPHTVGA